MRRERHDIGMLGVGLGEGGEEVDPRGVRLGSRQGKNCSRDNRLGCVPTCDLELVHGNRAFPGVETVMHTQRLDLVHSGLADTRAGLGHHKGLHHPTLPLYHTHSDGNPVGALLTPASASDSVLPNK